MRPLAAVCAFHFLLAAQPERIAITVSQRQGLPARRPPERSCCNPGEHLAMLYGLTATEARVAARLAAGRSVAEIADEHGVVVDTVRNQLKSSFAKTDTRRQSELVAAVLLGLAAS